MCCHLTVLVGTQPVPLPGGTDSLCAFPHLCRNAKVGPGEHTTSSCFPENRVPRAMEEKEDARIYAR